MSTRLTSATGSGGPGFDLQWGNKAGSDGRMSASHSAGSGFDPGRVVNFQPRG